MRAHHDQQRGVGADEELSTQLSLTTNQRNPGCLVIRAPTNAARSFNPQYGDVQRLGAVDSMTVRSTEGRETLLKLALPAPQGSGNAAGRLTRRGRPAAVRQLDDFLGPPRPRTLDEFENVFLRRGCHASPFLVFSDTVFEVE